MSVIEIRQRRSGKGLANMLEEAVRLCERGDAEGAIEQVLAIAVKLMGDEKLSLDRAVYQARSELELFALLERKRGAYGAIERTLGLMVPAAG